MVVFIKGLRDPLKMLVKVRNPNSLEQAISIARAEEIELGSDLENYYNAENNYRQYNRSGGNKKDSNMLRDNNNNNNNSRWNNNNNSNHRDNNYRGNGSRSSSDRRYNRSNN